MSLSPQFTQLVRPSRLDILISAPACCSISCSLPLLPVSGVVQHWACTNTGSVVCTALVNCPKWSERVGRSVCSWLACSPDTHQVSGSTMGEWSDSDYVHSNINTWQASKCASKHSHTPTHALTDTDRKTDRQTDRHTYTAVEHPPHQTYLASACDSVSVQSQYE